MRKRQYVKTGREWGSECRMLVHRETRFLSQIEFMMI